MSKVYSRVSLLPILTLRVGVQMNAGAAQAASPSTLTGCVRKDGNIYTLVDDATKNTVQLRGAKPHAGRHVEVTSLAAGTTQVMNVATIRRPAGSDGTNTADSLGFRAWI